MLTIPADSAFAGLDVERHPAVIDARVAHAALAGVYEECAATYTAACEEIGLAVVHDDEDVEEALGRLLISDGGLDKLERVKTLLAKLRAIRSASGIAAKNIESAIATARRALNPDVVKDVLGPARSAVARAYATFIESYMAHADLIRQCVALKLDYGRASLLFTPDRGAPLTPMPVRAVLQQLVTEGVLLASECEAVLARAR